MDGKDPCAVGDVGHRHRDDPGDQVGKQRVKITDRIEEPKDKKADKGGNTAEEEVEKSLLVLFVEGLETAKDRQAQIGRASCRERVCLSV